MSLLFLASLLKRTEGIFEECMKLLRGRTVTTVGWWHLAAGSLVSRCYLCLSPFFWYSLGWEGKRPRSLCLPHPFVAHFFKAIYLAAWSSDPLCEIALGCEKKYPRLIQRQIISVESLKVVKQLKNINREQNQSFRKKKYPSILKPGVFFF